MLYVVSGLIILLLIFIGYKKLKYRKNKILRYCEPIKNAFHEITCSHHYISTLEQDSSSKHIEYTGNNGSFSGGGATGSWDNTNNDTSSSSDGSSSND
ncbi:hypothetical protein ABFO59_05415 [Acinetobacter radioresistens]|uniref:hypothetical protein n=1 Tax=Acinetobacter radioresistens TaxID=40216 RepID=UPI00321219B3